MVGFRRYGMIAAAVAPILAFSAGQAAAGVVIGPPNRIDFETPQFFTGVGNHGLNGEPGGLSGSSVQGLFDFFGTAGGGDFVFAVHNNGTGTDAGAISKVGFFLPAGVDIGDYTLTLFAVTSSDDCWSGTNFDDGVCAGANTGFVYTLQASWVAMAGASDPQFPVGGGPPVVVDFGARAEPLGNEGVEVGEYSAFILRFDGPALAAYGVGDFYDAASGLSWCVRWQGGAAEYNANGDSDATCGASGPGPQYFLVPEPATLVLLASALLMAAGFRGRRRLLAAGSRIVRQPQ